MLRLTRQEEFYLRHFYGWYDYGDEEEIPEHARFPDHSRESIVSYCLWIERASLNSK